MKKLTIILFSVLFVAVAALFVLHFTGNKKVSGITAKSTETASKGIVYVNIDTIIFNFEMFADRRNELLNKQKNAEAELNSKGSQYEKGVKDYQDKVSKGLVTRATAAQMEQALLQQQQDLVNLRDKLQSDLIEEEQVMNRQIIDYITRFLEENKSQYNYNFILGKSFGGPVLYSDSTLDITYDVLKALNEKYRTEKK
ncbi:MAG TPA: OmpH family outer membrane protein [Bacteroidales bacterium]|nr:OmpH family outer membrane protein [Bacteroidales bacterium]HRR92787.1 OmpH family outer membrane protein [Bacteroidales bacterium]HRT90474.1 OmpH family outer membrane protein [Bacteroidales bacterium]